MESKGLTEGLAKACGKFIIIKVEKRFQKFKKSETVNLSTQKLPKRCAIRW